MIRDGHPPPLLVFVNPLCREKENPALSKALIALAAVTLGSFSLILPLPSW